MAKTTSQGIEAVSLVRSAKGKRPRYFLDPAVDHLHLMLLALIEELAVTRDRVDTLERLIEGQGLFKTSEVETYIPSAEVEEERTRWREAYIRRVMKGVLDEIAQVSRADPAQEFDEVVAAVSE